MIYFITVLSGKGLCVCTLKKEEENCSGAAAQDESVSPGHWISIEGARRGGIEEEADVRDPTLILVVTTSSQSELFVHSLFTNW